MLVVDDIEAVLPGVLAVVHHSEESTGDFAEGFDALIARRKNLFLLADVVGGSFAELHLIAFAGLEWIGRDGSDREATDDQTRRESDSPVLSHDCSDVAQGLQVCFALGLSVAFLSARCAVLSAQFGCGVRGSGCEVLGLQEGGGTSAGRRHSAFWLGISPSGRLRVQTPLSLPIRPGFISLADSAGSGRQAHFPSAGPRGLPFSHQTLGRKGFIGSPSYISWSVSNLWACP